MAEEYVEAGYVESGYVEGDINLSSAAKKKINFVVDNKNLGESDLKNLLSSSFGEEYENDVNVVFGSSLVVVEKQNGVTVMKEVAGQMKQEDIDAIDEKINLIDKKLSSSINSLSESIPSETDIKSSLLSDADFITSITSKVLQKIKVSIIALNGDEIVTNLTYNANKNAYVLDYDTSLLDGTDYTIELKIT